MSKKAPSIKSAKGDAAAEMVLNYVLSTNRPCGAIDLSANLKSKISKIQAAKTLAELAAAGEIASKAFGKTVIYCAPQKDGDTMSEAELATGRAEIDSLKVEEIKLKEELRLATSKRNSLGSQSKTCDLPLVLESLVVQCTTSSNLLASLASTPKISPAQLTQLSLSFDSTKTIAQKRRKIGIEIQGTLMEGLEMGKGREGEFWEDVGCDDISEIDSKRWQEVAEVEAVENIVKKK